MLKCNINHQKKMGKIRFSGTNQDLFIEVGLLLKKIQTECNSQVEHSGDEFLRTLAVSMCDPTSPIYCFKGVADTKETETTIRTAEGSWTVNTSTEED